MIHRRTASTAVLLAALVAVLALTIRMDGYYTDPAGLLWWYAAAWALFAAAAWSLRGVPARRTAALVLAGGVAVVATGLLAPPTTSTDSYRYAWDGRVQAAGISPYDHAPADLALDPLRDRWLFPAGAECRQPGHAPLPSRTVCSRLNRPTVHTIYPPVAEAYFFAVHTLSPGELGGEARHKPLQVGGALLALATIVALMAVLRRRGDVRLAACWAWCPAVPVEAVNNAHVDVLGVLLTVIALGVLSRSRIGGVVDRSRMLGGALLGGATAVKLLPAIVLTGALSGMRTVRGALGVLVPAGLVVALTYLPYVLASNASVLGYFAGYVVEEGYDDAGAANRYAVLRLVLPDSWAFPVAAVVLLAMVIHVLRNGDPERPWRGALLVTGTAFLLLTPGYSWYALLIVALVALDGRWEWLGVPLAGAVAYVATRVADGQLLGTAAYALAAAAVLAPWATSLIRKGRIRHDRRMVAT